MLYDTVENRTYVLKEATSTSDYTFSGCDEANGWLEIYESSVMDAKDWVDEQKVKDTKLLLPIPPND